MDNKYFQDILQEVTFPEGGAEPRILIQQGEAKAVLAGLKAGNQIPSHPESAALYYFLQGEGVMQVNDQKLPIAPGAVVLTETDDARGIQATTDLAFIAFRLGSPD